MGSLTFQGLKESRVLVLAADSVTCTKLRTMQRRLATLGPHSNPMVLEGQDAIQLVNTAKELARAIA